MKPDYAEAYNGLANVYNAQRKFDEAAAASAKANELSAPRPAAVAAAAAPTRSTTRASSSGTPARFRTRRSVRAAIAANPNHAESHYQLGDGARERGQAGGARRPSSKRT